VVVSGTYGTDRRGADDAGTYVLDGCGIELRFDSGRVEREVFGISTDDGHGMVRFGGDIMMSKKK
jgi:hypothetical protein